MLNLNVKKRLHEGTVIPAHPLALTEDRRLDVTRQRALTRYYIDAGAGGIAVGVHTTQFEIRDPKYGLYEEVLTLAIEEIKQARAADSFIKIGGISGALEQAINEATFLKNVGYDLGLLSMGGLESYSEEDLLERTKEVAKIIPVFGFYLQPSVGGRVLTYDFWKALADIPNVHAIKIAPFNRYQTLDVIRAVSHSRRNEEIAIYTGNDDNIVNDLLTTYRIDVNGNKVYKQVVGGLLGHWAVWTKQAVEIFNEIKNARETGTISRELLMLGQEITDANAAFFDADNNFKGCIAGINEVLARQGLLKGNWCLSENEKLSPGQSRQIDRVYAAYPHLHDDEFVSLNMEKWLT
ncbi:dihydrodipicolinate synthase family protein [Lederbergia panacisoli]|uniref:dihydrodipicolinate synthase family protein n=1 Tax=Lederbergia panacisoli TaxID=1255251 RepID=UPI00214C2EA4|nr:dihydrodipicolinate synthase family protein [Lederbergia panacisoli]MCR2821179.1 dihydrodipicolinate synthase family protein [Lederbergia panacisoli]